MSTQPTMAEIIRKALEARLADVWTALPGRVETYDAVTRTADISPVVRRPITTTEDDTIHEDLPVIPNVPILFPCGGGASITWPLLKGDHVQLLIQTLSPAQWRESGETSDPGDLRLHSLGNAYAIPGMSRDSVALPGSDFPAMVLEHAEIRLGVGATDFVALASLVTENIQRIVDAISGAATAPGDGGATFKTNMLLVINGVSPPALPLPIDVAATKVKAE
jgi:hypothetical protein